MKRFIFTDHNSIYIVDLRQTLTTIDKAYEFVKETVAHGGGHHVRRHQNRPRVHRRGATRVGMPIRQPALAGGMLTNFSTVHKRHTASRNSGHGTDRRLRGARKRKS